MARFVLCIAFFCVVIGVPSGGFGSDLEVSKELLYTLPDGVEAPLTDRTYSGMLEPQALHWACVCRKEGAEFVVADGRAHASFGKDIDYLYWSANGARVVYTVITKEGMGLVSNGALGKPYGLYGGVDWIAISDDGKHVAYEAGLEHGQCVVLDGIEGPALGMVFGIVFSSDGKRWACEAYVDDGCCIVVDGMCKKTYKEVSFPEFSPDSKHVAYKAFDGKDTIIILDDQEIDRCPPFLWDEGQYCAEPMFAPDSSLYKCEMPTRYGRPNPDLKTETVTVYPSRMTAILSADGRHFAYTADDCGEKVLVLDGVQRKIPGQFLYSYNSLTFSSDGAHLAYIVEVDHKQAVVIDDVCQKFYDEVADLTFSRDGKRLAYKARTANRWIAVIDGAEWNDLDHVSALEMDPAHKSGFIVYGWTGKAGMIKTTMFMKSGGKLYRCMVKVNSDSTPSGAGSHAEVPSS